jgi:hypothetical protein
VGLVDVLNGMKRNASDVFVPSIQEKLTTNSALAAGKVSFKVEHVDRDGIACTPKSIERI